MDGAAALKMNGAGDVRWVVMMAGNRRAAFFLFFFSNFPPRIVHLSRYLSVRAQTV